MTELGLFLRDVGSRMSEDDFLNVVRDAFQSALGGVEGLRLQGELPSHEIEILASGGLFPKRSGHDHNDPMLWGAIDYAAIIATALTASDVAEMLGVNSSRIRQRLTAREPSLYGIKPYGEWLLPRFQFWQSREVPGIAEVLAHIDRTLSPVSVVSWFTRPSPDLVAGDAEEPMSPLEWLKQGHDPGVVARIAAQL